MLINTNDNLIKGVMRFGPDILENCAADLKDVTEYLKRIEIEHLNYPQIKNSVDKDRWFIPSEYQNMDIEEFLVSQCPEQNYDRLVKELALFRQNNMIPVLKTMKYIVDTLRANNVVWGVGRGSSVASYVLHLIGIHKIDSVKYNLPIDEFFKGEQNG
jgi:DNA polymerase III alpha subunit